MSDDAVRSFESLLDSVPGWIAELEGILRATTEKQNALLVEIQPAELQSVEPAALPWVRKPSKSSSLRSKRSADDISLKQFDVSRPSPVPSAVRPQMPHLTQSDALRVVQRKRKTASNMSGQSGPPRIRPRTRLVVFYDGDAQKGFEKMVRTVGTCRNGVRKGKMSAKIDFLSRTGSSSSEASHSTCDEARLSGISNFNTRTKRGPRSAPSAFGRESDLAAFDQIERCLEKCQAMCEKAAHQLLRDGDCFQEINTAKEQFAQAKTVAEAELPKLRQRAEQVAKRRKEEEAESERKRVAAQAQRPASKADSQEPLVIAASPISLDDKLEVDLEVDEDDEDDDDDEGEFQIPSMQLPMSKFSPMRGPPGARLASPIH